ncbi:MAG: ribonuclease Z [Candidatus Micrarchaeaceae archaeon]
MIKVTFLGTSGSAPTKGRNLPGVALTYEGETLLFDCGEGTQRQMMRFGVNISSISAVFITHMHGDHIIGIAGLLRTFALNRREEPLYIFVPKGGEAGVRALLTFDHVLMNYPIIVRGISGGVIFKRKNFRVKAFRLNHTVPTYGYALLEKDKLHFIKDKCKKLGIKGRMFSELLKKKEIKVNGKTAKLGDVTYTEKGLKILYVTDTRPIKDVIKEAQGADLLIHEATFSEVHKKLAIERKHSTALEAAKIAKEARAKKLLLFHFSARYKNTAMLIKEAKSAFENVQAAKDGMTVLLEKDKKERGL